MLSLILSHPFLLSGVNTKFPVFSQSGLQKSLINFVNGFHSISSQFSLKQWHQDLSVSQDTAEETEHAIMRCFRFQAVEYFGNRLVCRPALVC